MPSDTSAQARQYARVARAIAFIRENAARQPSLEEIAAAVHLSPCHLQRIFSEWAGISPKRFLQYLTKEFAKGQLAASRDLLTVAEDTGLSSTSRLHDLMVSCEAMTPGEIRHAGAGLEIAYGFAPTPFGDAIVAWTGRGICHLAFSVAAPALMTAELMGRWPNAVFRRAAPAGGDIPGRTDTRESASVATRHQFPDQGLGNPAPHRIRTGRLLPAARRAGGLRPGTARRRQRPGGEPARFPDPLPPRAPRKRRGWQLPLGSRPQACPARLGGGRRRAPARNGLTASPAHAGRTSVSPGGGGPLEIHDARPYY